MNTNQPSLPLGYSPQHTDLRRRRNLHHPRLNPNFRVHETNTSRYPQGYSQRTAYQDNLAVSSHSQASTILPYNPTVYGVVNSSSPHRQPHYPNNGLPQFLSTPSNSRRAPTGYLNPTIAHHAPTIGNRDTILDENRVDRAIFHAPLTTQGLSLSERLTAQNLRSTQFHDYSHSKTRQIPSNSFGGHIEAIALSSGEHSYSHNSPYSHNSSSSSPIPHHHRRFSGYFQSTMDAFVAADDTTFVAAQHPVASENFMQFEGEIDQDYQDDDTNVSVAIVEGKMRGGQRGESSAAIGTGREQYPVITQNIASSSQSENVGETFESEDNIALAMATARRLQKNAKHSRWGQPAAPIGERVLADSWSMLGDHARLARIRALVTSNIWAWKGFNDMDPFNPAVFLIEAWEDLFNMAKREPVIRRELRRFLSVREMMACGLFLDPPPSEDLITSSMKYKFMYSESSTSPFDRIYVKEIQVFLPAPCGYFKLPNRVKCLSHDDRKLLEEDMERYHNQQAARLAELPLLIKYAHQTFFNLKTITFHGDLGRQRTWSPEAIRRPDDETYVHPANANVIIERDRTEAIEKLDKELTTEGKFRKLFKKAGKIFKRRKSTAVRIVPYELTIAGTMPMLVANRSSVEFTGTQCGAWRSFFSHPAVMESIRYIKDQDRVTVVNFARGFFADHKAAAERDDEIERIIAADAKPGHATSNTAGSLAVDPKNFIAKHARNFTVTRNVAGGKVESYRNWANLPLTNIEMATELEKYQIRLAQETWGSIDDGINDRSNYLHFYLVDKAIGVRLQL